MMNSEQETEKKAAMKRKSEGEKEGSKAKSRRNSDMDEEIPATQSPPKRSETEKKSIVPEYKNKLTNKFLNKLKNDERGSRGISMVSSPSIMMSSTSPSKPSTSSANLEIANFISEVKSKVKKIDVDEIFDKLKETGDDEDDRKEPKKSSSEVKKPKQDQRSPNKSTTEEASFKLPALAFQPDTEWSIIKANNVKHLKESTANLRVMIEELNEAKLVSKKKFAELM